MKDIIISVDKNKLIEIKEGLEKSLWLIEFSCCGTEKAIKQLYDVLHISQELLEQEEKWKLK